MSFAELTAKALMSVLLFLPDELARHLLVDWLSFKAVGTMDSACLSRAGRERFLNIISDAQSVFAYRDHMIRNFDKSFLTWAARRGVRLKSVCISVELENHAAMMTTFFQVSGPSLLTIEFTNETYKGSHDSLLSLVVENCRNLEELTLVEGIPNGQDFLGDLSLGCPCIKRLTFNECIDYEGESETRLSMTALRHFHSIATPLSDNIMTALAQGSKNLVELNLDSATGITPHSLSVVACNCFLLHTVKLHNMSVTDEHVLPLVTSCRNLRTFEVMCPVDEFTDQSLHIMAHNCKLLVNLLLEECGGITDDGMEEVCKGCTALRDLSLTGGMFLTDNTLYSIAEHCTKLTHLNIASGSFFSDNGLLEVAEYCMNLQRVVFSSDGALTQNSANLFDKEVEVVCEEGFNDYMGDGLQGLWGIIGDGLGQEMDDEYDEDDEDEEGEDEASDW